ncbi:hypothetical protein COCNU_09G000100 [Cocos nucifera]|uniref:Uncharacterized protein n=1 Tax=Cocos nucifera TaxID=13894 RepID=A0A8K0IIN3_COCNU|nr:hypothetical protein COCNU_09G000100 [Cocos nucifera]
MVTAMPSGRESLGSMEFGTERTASSDGSWEPYWHVMGRMESGTERKASSGGSWEPYWQVVGRMESGTERKASSDLVAGDSSSRGVRTCNRVRLKEKPGRSLDGRTGVCEKSVSRRSPAAWSPRSSTARKFDWRWEFGPKPGRWEFD